MAQYQITIDKKLLHQLFSNDDALASLVQKILNQILKAQVAEHLGAGHYQRAETRQGYRKGYRPRMLKTRVGKLTLEVPKVREGHFSTFIAARSAFTVHSHVGLQRYNGCDGLTKGQLKLAFLSRVIDVQVRER